MSERQQFEAIDLNYAMGPMPDEDYNKLLQSLRGLVLGKDGERHTALRLTVGEVEELMPAGRVLANLILLFPYRAAGIEFENGRVVRGPLDARSTETHMNDTIAELYGLIDPEDLSRAAASATGFLADLASAITGRVGTSISIKSLFEAAERDPEIKRLLYWSAPPGELGDIEKAADEASADLASRLQALPGEYGRLLRCGAAVNRDQMRQALVSIGVKPGLEDGQLIPEPIDTSFLRGMRGPQDHYICAIGARKALTTNYRQVKASGYLARKLVLLVSGHSVDPGLEDCGTVHGIQTTIQSEDHARRLQGRFICDSGAGGESQQYSVEELTGAVGEEVILRSPITCAGQNGVCHVCYGELARSNSRVHAGVYGTLVISEQITQRLLSSKHLLKARPTPIEWPDEFLKSFSIERAAVIPESSVDKIFVSAEDIEDGEEDEARLATSVFYYHLAGRQGRTRVAVTVPIYLDEEAWENAQRDDTGELSIVPLPEAAAFQVPVTNTDLSEALYAIFSLIEREEVVNHHEAYNRLMDLLRKSEIHTPSVHAEMVLRALVRNPENHMSRPDFSGPDEPAVTVLRLTPAILSSPSVTNSLAFERVKAQLTGVEILKKREAGILDVLFGG